MQLPAEAAFTVAPPDPSGAGRDRLCDLLARPTFYLRAFGCQMNEHDSERIHGMLHAEGLRRVAQPEEAGLIYNTCTARKPDSALWGIWGTARRLKTRDSGVVVVVAGCLAQSRGEDGCASRRAWMSCVGAAYIARLPSLCAEDWRKGRGERTGSHHVFVRRSAARGAKQRSPGMQIMTDAPTSVRTAWCFGARAEGPGPRTTSSPRVGVAADGVREVTLPGRTSMPMGGSPGSTARTISS